MEREYLTKQYGPRLFFPPSKSAKIYWIPNWSQSFQMASPDAAMWTYVPLESSRLAWIGFKKYLVGSQVAGKLVLSEATYYFKEGDNQANGLGNMPGFFKAFTGTLTLKNLATGRQALYVCKKGVVQEPLGGGSPETCRTTTTCYWSGYCTGDFGFGSSTTFGTATIGYDTNCDSPGPDAVGCSNILWTLTYSDTVIDCDAPGGGGDPNDPGGGGGGGGDPNDPGNPSNPPTPCQTLNFMGPLPAFSLATNTLVALAGRNYESGFIYGGGGIFPASYTAVQGAPNGGSIGLSNVSYPLSGAMHTHPPGTLSIFSTADLAFMWQLHDAGLMDNPNSFILTVVTAGGVDYALQINNLAQFVAFGQSWLTDDFMTKALEDTRFANTNYGGYGILAGQTAANNERNFLKFLQDENTGLIVSKHDRNQNTWQQLGLDANGLPTNVPCP